MDKPTITFQVREGGSRVVNPEPAQDKAEKEAADADPKKRPSRKD
jgi:hypothetical protein